MYQYHGGRFFAPSDIVSSHILLHMRVNQSDLLLRQPLSLSISQYSNLINVGIRSGTMPYR